MPRVRKINIKQDPGLVSINGELVMNGAPNLTPFVFYACVAGNDLLVLRANRRRSWNTPIFPAFGCGASPPRSWGFPEEEPEETVFMQDPKRQR